MSPECLYWVALFALVLPSLPFNKMALVVLAVWAFGHVVYRVGPYDDVACMFARIMAIGAALAVSHPWDGSRRAYADAVVTFLFVPSALLAAYSAINFEHPPVNMEEYYQQIFVYWAGWGIIMLQAIAVPFGNDWGKLVKLDDWLMGKIVKHF